MDYLLQIIVALVVLAVGGLTRLVFSQGSQLTELRLHVAEHYITGPEIDKVETAILELTKGMARLSDIVTSIKADLEAQAKYGPK